jgi:multiple RNA-binding domain-containing protein 1
LFLLFFFPSPSQSSASQIMDVTSRIFVRNLPPSLKESEFKSHFSTKESITDVKLIPHRRIGYVGYKTPEAAAKAVKYFNKTFIRMSRIGVELAKSVDELQQVQNERAERNGHTRHEYDDRPGKRIRVEETAKDIENPRLKEYLDVMRPSAKSKTWANGDMAAESQPEDIIAKVPVTEDANGSDDEYEVVPKKRKLVSETAPMEQDIATIPTPPAEEEQPKVEAALVEPEEAPMSTEEVPLPASDADWMRSRTSRLLGLMDDDEIDARASGPEPSLVTTTAGAKVDRAAPEGVQAVPEPVLAPVREAAIDLVQNEGTASDEAPAATAAGTPSVQDTGRLFVRNLSYETKQDDLRGCFVTYGPVEEVRLNPFSIYFPIALMNT